MDDHIENLQQKLLQCYNENINRLSSLASADREKIDSRSSLSNKKVENVQEVQILTNLVHKLYQQQYHIEKDIEMEYKKKCEKLREYDFQATCMEEQLATAMSGIQKKTEHKNSNNIQKNKDFVAALLHCEDIEIRNYMENVYNKFEKVYKENMEIESTDADIAKPRKIDVLEQPKLLLLFWYKVLNRELNQMKTPNANDSVCVDVSEIVSSTSSSDNIIKSISVNATKDVFKQEIGDVNHVDILSFRTFYNTMTVKIIISIVNRNIKNIHFNSDPFLPNLNSKISSVVVEEALRINTEDEMFKCGEEFDIVKLTKSIVWPLIEKRLSLRSKSVKGNSVENSQQKTTTQIENDDDDDN